MELFRASVIQFKSPFAERRLILLTVTILCEVRLIVPEVRLKRVVRGQRR